MKLKFKKRIAAGLIIACSFSTVNSNAQSPAWDSTARPASYQLKWDQFKSFPNSTKDIIFLGNSITAGVDWDELLQNPNVKNRGISGDITFGVLERLKEVTEGHPQKVFILIGTNDISRKIPDDIILENYKRMIDQIKRESPATKIYFQTILPVNNEVKQVKGQEDKPAHILAVNKKLKQLGDAEKITVVDIYTPFLDAAGKLDKNLTYDGLHLNINGYRVWAKVLMDGKYL